jgi:hypothetical protein
MTDHLHEYRRLAEAVDRLRKDGGATGNSATRAVAYAAEAYVKAQRNTPTGCLCRDCNR